MNTSPDIRVAIVGYGVSGRIFHGPLISATPGFVVTTIVTGDAVRQEQARFDHPRVRVLSSPSELWEISDEHDLVVVATSTGTHLATASRAVDTGLAVVVEKPLASCAEEARRLVEKAREKGTVLTVFQNRRWDSDHLTLIRLIEEEALGSVMRYESRFERWRPEAGHLGWRDVEPPEKGGGILLDLGVHLVDQALELFGPPDSVYAEVFARRGGADDDVFIDLAHRSGVRSHLWASVLSAAPGPRLRVLGAESAFVVQSLDGQEEALRAGRHPDDPSFGEELEERWGRLFLGDSGVRVRAERGSWRYFYVELGHAIRDGSPVPVDPQSAVDVLEVLDTARRSSAEGAAIAL